MGDEVLHSIMRRHLIEVSVNRIQHNEPGPGQTWASAIIKSTEDYLFIYLISFTVRQP
jgi:hypothetical protein